MFPCREFYENFENDLEHEELEDGEVHGEDDENAGIEAADLDNQEDQEDSHSYEDNQHWNDRVQSMYVQDDPNKRSGKSCQYNFNSEQTL